MADLPEGTSRHTLLLWRRGYSDYDQAAALDIRNLATGCFFKKWAARSHPLQVRTDLHLSDEAGIQMAVNSEVLLRYRMSALEYAAVDRTSELDVSFGPPIGALRHL